MNDHELSNIELNKSNIQVGNLVEAINDFGYWEAAKIIKVTENKLSLHFLNNKNLCRILNFSSNKWRHLNEYVLNDINDNINNSQNLDQFKIGDIILARWQDEKFYLAKILEINTKAKFGTKTKEYKIIYLYDNIKDSVLETRIKAASFQDLQVLNDEQMKQSDKKQNISRKKSLPEIKLDDNVFYDEKTKIFAEKCRKRRQRLSQDNEVLKTESIEQIPEESSKDVEIKFEPKKRFTNKTIKQSFTIINDNPVEQSPNQTPRISQRKRKCPYKNSDYFYPESFDQIFSEKSAQSNSAQLSSNELTCNPITLPKPEPEPVSTEDFSQPTPINVEIDNREIEVSLNSPDIVSFTSEESPNKKSKLTSDEFDDSMKSDRENLYSQTDDGKFQCQICCNKSFRKRQSVLDHIKHYHQNDVSSPNQTFTPQKPKLSSKRYFSNYLKNNRNSLENKRPVKRYSKSFNRLANVITSSMRTDNAYKKTYSSHLKYRSFTSSEANNYLKSPMNKSTQEDYSKSPHSPTTSPNMVPVKSATIIYCHRCKRCNDDGNLIQCQVCLCWSHSVCYGLNKIRHSLRSASITDDNDSTGFWQCDDCCNPLSELSHSDSSLLYKTNGQFINKQWLKDKWRFYHLPRNKFPGGFNCDESSPLPPSSSSSLYFNNLLSNNNNSTNIRNLGPNNNFRNLCESQSILSVCRKILMSLTRQIDKLYSKNSNTGVTSTAVNNNNESNSQDELDILNIDEIGPIVSFGADAEDLFKLSSETYCHGNKALDSSALQSSVNGHNTTQIQSHNSITNQNQQVTLDLLTNNCDIQFNELHFINSTPNKCQTQISSCVSNNSTNKQLNNSLDGILLDCDFQKLDLLPKADFDALVKDLRQCEETVNSNSENNKIQRNNNTINNSCHGLSNINNNNTIISDSCSKININSTHCNDGNLLDIIDGTVASQKSINSNNNNSNRLIDQTIDSSNNCINHLTTSNNNFQNLPIFSSNTASLIDSEITNFLIDKDEFRSNSKEIDLFEPSNQIYVNSSMKTNFTTISDSKLYNNNSTICTSSTPMNDLTTVDYLSDIISWPRNCTSLTTSITNTLITNTETNKNQSHHPLPSCAQSSELPIIPQSATFDSRWLSSIFTTTTNNNNNNNNVNSTQLSHISPQLIGLLNKYQHIERIVELISESILAPHETLSCPGTTQSSSSQHSTSALNFTNNALTDLSKISRYLQHVLFVLRKTENTISTITSV